MNHKRTEVLFVGGPLDNRVILLDERHAQYRFTQVAFDKAEEIIYIISTFSGELCQWRIARPKDQGADETMQKLVDWYCGGRLEPRCNLPKGE